MSSARIITRRRVLKAAGVVSVGPLFVPGTALGKDGGVAASNRIAIGQIGFNWIGGSHLGGLLGRNDVRYVAACEVHAHRLKGAADRIDRQYKHGAGDGIGRYGDFREMLSRDDLDAVVIAVPDHWHALMAVEAAKAGKDIYCEKPISLTIRQGREMVNAVRRYGRVFQTGSQQRSQFGGRFRRAVELVRNGYLGEVRHVAIGVGQPPRACDLPGQTTPDYVDWNMWLGPAPYRPYHEKLADKHWRPYSEYCGGGLADMGAHHFDIAQWALGMDDSGPVEVIAPNSDRHPGYPDDGKKGHVCFRYANGVVMHHRGASGCTFYGSEGKLYVDRGALRSWPGSILDTGLRGSDFRVMPSNNHHTNWIEAMKRRSRPIADVEIGHRTATICHLGNLCYQLKRDLKWDPVNEQFEGDEQANRMKDRAMRASWDL